MSINLDNVTAIVHNNKDVIKIEDSNGNVIWQSGPSYYSNIFCNCPTPFASNQFDPQTQTVSAKTWTNAPTDAAASTFSGRYVTVWKGNAYYIDGSSQAYKLDLATSTWSTVPWPSYINYTYYLWTDGNHLYYSNSTTHYVLGDDDVTWSNKTWTGPIAQMSFNGAEVWTDGTDIYISGGSAYQYVLDRTTGVWSNKTWNGFNPGSNICNVNGEIWYIVNGRVRKLDKATSTWSAESSFTGWNASSAGYDYLWYDGINYHMGYTRSSTNTSHILDIDTLEIASTGGISGSTYAWSPTHPVRCKASGPCMYQWL